MLACREEQMPERFGIFKQQPDGSPYWIEAVENLGSAKARAYDLAESFPGQYVIVDSATGERTFIPEKQ